MLALSLTCLTLGGCRTGGGTSPSDPPFIVPGLEGQHPAYSDAYDKGKVYYYNLAGDASQLAARFAQILPSDGWGRWAVSQHDTIYWSHGFRPFGQGDRDPDVVLAINEYTTFVPSTGQNAPSATGACAI